MRLCPIFIYAFTLYTMIVIGVVTYDCCTKITITFAGCLAMALSCLTGLRICQPSVSTNETLIERPLEHLDETNLYWSKKLQSKLTHLQHGLKCGSVEFAFNHGTTTLAFKYSGGAIVAADSRASSGSYIASGTTEKILKINQYLLGTMAGGAADCAYWERVLSKQCRLFELRNKERMSVAAASKLLANMLFEYKGAGLSVGTTIVGWDKKGPGVYYVDNDGHRMAGDLFSVGSGSMYAYGVLDTHYKYHMKDEDAYELARRAIFHATHRDAASGGIINVYHMTKDGWKFIGKYDVADLYHKDWELRQTFQAAVYLLAPEVVFILGDIFDEGLWINDDELDSELIRYRRIFHHDPSVTILKNIVGNHDIGFHYAIHPYFDYRFRRKLTPAANSSAVRLWTHAGVHFVLANSMAFEGDECNLCSEAEYDVYAIGQYLSCAPMARSAKCDPRVDYSHPPYQLDMDSDRKRPTVYTRPILLQHFPLFRPNELACPATPLDAMPAHLRRVAYRPKWDCLSEKASQQLLRQLRPRLVLSGHSHYSCLLHHKIINDHSEELIPEITVASFTWRNVQTPSFTLLTVSPTEHATVTCFLPKQSTIFILYISTSACTQLCLASMASSSDDVQGSSRLIGPSLEADDVCPVGGIGPALPLDVFKSKIMQENKTWDDTEDSRAENLATIGPLVPGQELQEEFRHLKSGPTNRNDPGELDKVKLKRDAWMTELLPISREAGALKARKFEQRIASASGACDSSWFKVPGSVDSGPSCAETVEKQTAVTSWEREADREYDKRMDEMLCKTQTSTGRASLLDLHKKKSVKENKKESKKERRKKHKSKHKKHKSDTMISRSPEKPTRRPFDRDRDLKGHLMDPAARQALIHHSKQLSSRFGHGSRHFL
ncbi:unnamed protein product [Dicrocoelium dendriticum]|nr:unnamed protein product [Dicrocoelium dendriticum]